MLSYRFYVDLNEEARIAFFQKRMPASLTRK